MNRYRRSSGGILVNNESNGSRIPNLGQGPEPLPEGLIPVDLRPRQIQEYGGGGGSSGGEGGDLLSQIANDTRVISSTLVLSRGLIGRVVVVQTTPTLLVDARFLRGYLFLNPALTTGLTSSITVFPSAVRAGTGLSASVGVGNFLEAHFHLDVTAVSGGGTVTITHRSIDPLTGLAADVQDIFVGVGAVGTFYSYVGRMGMADTSVFFFSVPVGTVTFSMSMTVKDGLAGTSTGAASTIFLGGPGVSTVSGYPLLSEKEKAFYLTENTQLFGVAASPLPLRIFEL